MKLIVIVFRPLLAALSMTVAVGAAASSAALPTSPANAASAHASPLLGFTADGSAAQRQLEQRFDAQLSASEMRDWLKRLATEPNQVGAPHDKLYALLQKDVR